MELREVVEQAKRGDALAFQRLVDNYRDMALGYAKTLVRHDDVAEDTVQDALVIAHQKLGGLLDSEAFAAWFRGIVRNRCHHANRGEATASLDDVDEVGDDQNLEGELIDRMDHRLVLNAVVQLPANQQTVLSLHYSEGLSQAEISARLGVSKGTVNMRLHAARTRLRRRLTMNENTTASSPIGHITASEGALVTLQFTPGEIPLIFSRLSAGREEFCVVRALTDGAVQAISTRLDAIWTPGQTVQDTCQPFMESLADDIAASVVHKTKQSDATLKTGIKTIDLFAPMAQSSATGVFAEWGLGTLVLLPELVARLHKTGSRQEIFCFMTPMMDAGEWRNINAEVALGSRQVEVFYIPVADPISPEFVERVANLNTRLILSRRLAEQGIWPCIDPIRSSSRLRDTRRDSLANQLRALIQRYYLLQYSAEPEASRKLSAEDWLTVRRARLATRFLGQPFFVAEPYTNQPGVDADIEIVTDTFEGILVGRYDDRSKEEFTMTGAVPKGK